MTRTPVQLLALFTLFATFGQAHGQIGYLKVASFPEGAQITIDGTAAGQAGGNLETAEAIQLEPGPHNLYVFIEGLDDFFEVVEIVAGDTAEVFVPLAEPKGFLTVVTEPEDAEVSIADSSIGFTPLTRIPLPTRTHPLSITKECFLPERRNVEVEPGRETRVDLSLRQQIRLAANSALEVQRVEICQTGRTVSATYVLAGQPEDRFDVYPVLRRQTGELLSMPINGSYGDKVAPGSDKRIVIQIAPNIPETETVDLSFNVMPSKGGGGGGLLYVALGAVAVAGGAAVAFLAGGGGGNGNGNGNGTVLITSPPSPPGGG